MDTGNIVLWVSVCRRNVNDFVLAAFESYMESKVFYVDLYFSVSKYRIHSIIPALLLILFASKA